jgi:hypothetical protein
VTIKFRAGGIPVNQMTRLRCHVIFWICVNSLKERQANEEIAINSGLIRQVSFTLSDPQTEDKITACALLALLALTLSGIILSSAAYCIVIFRLCLGHVLRNLITPNGRKGVIFRPIGYRFKI